MASTRKRLGDVARAYLAKAQLETERARELAREASEAARAGNTTDAAILSAQAAEASANAKYYNSLAANPQQAP